MITVSRSTVDERDVSAFQWSPVGTHTAVQGEARRFLPQCRGAASPWIPAAAAPGLLPERSGAAASTHLGLFVEQAHLDHAQQELRTLVHSGFSGAPVMHGREVIALAYLRWWSNGWMDLLTVHAPRDAIGHRISGVTPAAADLLQTARLQWILRGDVATTSRQLRQLAAPTSTSSRIKMRPADQQIAALQERGLVPDPHCSLAAPGVERT